MLVEPLSIRLFVDALPRGNLDAARGDAQLVVGRAGYTRHRHRLRHACRENGGWYPLYGAAAKPIRVCR